MGRVIHRTAGGGGLPNGIAFGATKHERLILIGFGKGLSIAMESTEAVSHTGDGLADPFTETPYDIKGFARPWILPNRARSY